MCHDLSFSANTVEFIHELLPDIVFNRQIDLDFMLTSHVLSMSHRKCLVIYDTNGTEHLNLFEWGLIAGYMNTPELIKKYRIQMANARSENILDKKSAWYRMRKQRCLVAVDGIYEHRSVAGIKNKIPYYISLKSGEPMLLPGLYNYSPIPDPETGEMKGTFTILTRDANDLMKKIHNDGANKHRMPVFMNPVEVEKWIKEDLTDAEISELLAYEIPSEQLNAWPVYMIRTTKERPDKKEKFEPFVYDNLPPLGDDEVKNKQQGLFGE
jgi:putative SOS response-associated peptidase YedK